MIFRFQRRRRIPGEARRVLLEQVDHALRALEPGPSVKAVHEARKACKRARATVALIEDGIGPLAARRVQVAFRDAARVIGPIRDHDVARANLKRLGLPEPEEPADREERGRMAIEGLQHARRLVDALDTGGVDRAVLTRGLARTWGETRATFRTARRDPTGEHLHEWRKHTKRLLYHLQLVEPQDPAWLSPLVAVVDQLQEQLGEHHDLAVLAGLLDADPVAQLRLSTRSAWYEQRTLSLASWLLAGREDAFARWLDGLGAAPPG